MAGAALSKRQDLEDQMKRRAIERQLAELAKKNPAAMVQIASSRKPGSGAYAVAPGGPAAAIAERRAGATGGVRNGAVTGVYAGSPAAVGDKWRVSDAERLAGDTYNVGRDNRPVPSDMQTQQSIRDRLNADLDKSADIQRALLARGNAAGAPAVTPAAAAVDPKKAAEAKEDALTWQMKINTEKAKAEPNMANLKLYEEQLAAATGAATPAAATPAPVKPAPFTVQTPAGPVISNQRDKYYPPAAPDAALAAKRGPSQMVPSHTQTYGAVPLASAPTAPAAPAGPAPQMITTIDKATGQKIQTKAIKLPDGSWQEVS